MSTQIVSISTGKELKLVKQNGFFKFHDKVYTGDHYESEPPGNGVLVINKEVAIVNLDDVSKPQ